MTKTDFTKPIEQFRPGREDIEKWNGQIDDLSGADDLDSVMRTMACIVDHCGAMGMDHLCAVYHKALDWLQSLKTRLETANEKYGAVRIIEYSTCTANSDGEPIEETRHDMCLVYNRTVISDEDAEALLREDRHTLDARVLNLWPDQVAALFPERQADNEEKEAGKNA